MYIQNCYCSEQCQPAGTAGCVLKPSLRLIMVTITRYIFINISQTECFTAVKFAMRLWEKNELSCDTKIFNPRPTKVFFTTYVTKGVHYDPLWKFVIKHHTFIKVVPNKVPTLHVCRSCDVLSNFALKWPNWVVK